MTSRPRVNVRGSTSRTPITIAALCALFMQFVIAIVFAPAAHADFVVGDHISSDLVACRNNGGIVLPNGDGKYICADTDYVQGNLGKGWNELDLVPHRVTLKRASNSSTPIYNIIVGGDYQLGGKTGYDVVSAPELNVAKSDASCQISSGDQYTQAAPTGGADTGVFRQVQITQDPGTTCVIDYYQRLALGAHLYSGSSLQSYQFLTSDFSQGKQTLSLPVNQIAPQELSKDMSAEQGNDYAWNITKSATPASITVANTCATPGVASSRDVQIKVTYTKLAATPTAITVMTHVYATNPAARVVTASVTDNVYSGVSPNGTLVHTASSGAMDIPANTANFLMLSETFTVAAGPTAFYDHAVATYTDKATGVPIPGSVTADATAAVQVTSTTNNTATISDVESITGSGLTFAVTSVTGTSGSFAGGYDGSATTGPVTWTSTAQSASGTVTFNKTVYAAAGTVEPNGNLHDAATVNGANGFSKDATLDVGIDVNTLGSLTIDKTIPDVLTGSETASFDFLVTPTVGDPFTKTVSFSAGQTHETVTATDLPLGGYTVAEQPVTDWKLQPPQDALITGTSVAGCAVTTSFVNSFAPAIARAVKTTVPTGNEAGWEMVLTGPGTPAGGEKVLTDASGIALFTTSLQDAGTYTISETPKAGFDQTSATGDLTFTVNYPADNDRVFEAQFTNTERGALTVHKTVNWNGVTPDTGQTFTITITGPSYPSGDSKQVGYNGGDVTWTNLLPGDYVVTESDPGTSWVVAGSGVTVSVAPGDTGAVAAATITNTRKLGSLIVTKTVNWNGVTPDPNQTFTICITGPSFPTPTVENGGCQDIGYNGGSLTWNNLIPGTYTVSEVNPGSTWTVEITDSPATVPTDGGTATASVTNSRKLGSLKVTKVVDWNGITPDQSQTFTITITGPSYPSGDSKQVGYNGGDVTWTNLIPGDYTVTEGALGTSWTVNITGSPATVPTDGGQATATVTNTRKLGSLKVTKVVNWNGITPDQSQTFTITITGPSYPSGDSKQVGYNGGDVTWTNLIPGDYTVTEGALGTSWTVNITGSPATVPTDGGQATATVTNTRKLGSLVVTKVVNWSGVTADTSQTFTICITGPSYPSGDCKQIGYNGGDLTWTNLIPGSYTVTENNPGTSWTVLVTGSPAGVPADGGQASATVTNTFKPGYVRVVKTVEGLAPTGSDAFTFQLRQGASPTSDGTTLETGVANAANGGVVNFATKLIPGQTYQMCEIVMPGWTTSLTGFVPNAYLSDGVTPNPSVDNSYVCQNFTAQPGPDPVVITVDNTPPPGGNARTIGFWKNWSSCKTSNGKQAPVLDQTLAAAEPNGVVVSATSGTYPVFGPTFYLVLHGSTATPDAAPSCAAAVSLLNKSPINGGKKAASDPAFNLAAQLVAAELNYAAGAEKTGAATTAINQAVLLLGSYHFNGITHTPISKADSMLMNQLAKVLDDYNNNR